jgi:hypothetical protein
MQQEEEAPAARRAASGNAVFCGLMGELASRTSLDASFPDDPSVNANF